MNEELQNEYVDVDIHDNYPSSDEHVTVPPMKVQPLKKICMTIGQLPTSYLETMTYYEMLLWFIGYLRDTIIPTVNTNGEALEEVQTIVMNLQTYINNFKDSIDQDVEDLEAYMNDYFENLDVQEEINNKLDDMLEDGTLQSIIQQYFEVETPEKFGAVGDGLTDDTEAWQDAIDYCINNHKTLFGRSGKTYLVDTLTINSDINIDGNYCTLKSSGDNVLNISYTNLGSNFIKNINIIDVPANKIGIYCNPARRYTLENITMNNISGTGIKVDTYGGGILVKNYKITGNTTDVQTVGLDVRGTSDGVYKDIIMIDMFVGAYISGGNFFKNVHPWIATASIFNGSKAFVISGGQAMFDNCYPDTYMYSYYITNNAFVNINQCRQFHNIYVANNNTIENAGGNTYALYYDNEATSKNTFIHNSIFQNQLDNNVKYANQTNLVKPYYNIDRTTQWIGMKDGQGLKYVELVPTFNQGYSSFETHAYLNNNICWYNLRILTGQATANTEITIGKVDTNFLPAHDIKGIAYYGDGPYKIDGACLFRITASNGNIGLKFPTNISTNANQTIINVCFFTTQQS